MCGLCDSGHAQENISTKCNVECTFVSISLFLLPCRNFGVFWPGCANSSISYRDAVFDSTSNTGYLIIYLLYIYIHIYIYDIQHWHPAEKNKSKIFHTHICIELTILLSFQETSDFSGDTDLAAQLRSFMGGKGYPRPIPIWDCEGWFILESIAHNGDWRETDLCCHYNP
jgi:hypothetical protein